MTFTGKTTYGAGATLPELAEDVSDIISIVSPHETPLLHRIGDPQRAATSTVHEWLEDTLFPNSDQVNDQAISNPATDTVFTVDNGSRFRVGDQIMLEGKAEVMLITGVSSNDLTVVRNYGGSASANVADNDVIKILGNAALEGDAAPATRFTSRTRKQNYTQIFTAAVEVSGSQLAAQSIGLDDEMDYQKQERLRELLRDLENCVINGVAPTSTQQGSATVRRTMRGIIASLQTNVFTPGDGPIPDGDGASNLLLTEDVLNAALRAVWEQSSGTIDTIVCGGFQKRRINGFISASQRYIEGDDHFSSLVNVYESDYGVCQVVMSRWVPQDKVLLVDSSRLAALPLAGRSFHFKELASSGDSYLGQLIGEYTLEMRNENAHAVLYGLDAA